MDTNKKLTTDDNTSTSSLEKEVSEFINKSESQSKVVKRLIESISKKNIDLKDCKMDCSEEKKS
jgi:hypothetical protein